MWRAEPYFMPPIYNSCLGFHDYKQDFWRVDETFRPLYDALYLTDDTPVSEVLLQKNLEDRICI